eukprot:jgi/Psemu1/291134/fgenesh1_pg.629_\
MSSNPELSRVRTPPSSSTITALMLTYRPIIFMLFAGPSLFISLPLASMVFGSILDGATDQHSLLAICMTAIVLKLLEHSITKAAPTKEKGLKSLEQSRGMILLVAFAASVVSIQLIVSPLGKVLGLRSTLTWRPSISFTGAIRLALGGFLLGLSIESLYLITNAFYASQLLDILDHSLSICRPDDVRKPQQTERSKINPRRLQLPSSKSLAAQIAVSIVAAVAVAFTSVLPFSHDESFGENYPAIKMMVILLCIVSTTMQLLLTTIQGTNHEIDPTQYRTKSIEDQANLLNYLKSVGPFVFAIPVLVVSICVQNASFRWSDTLVCLVTVSSPIALYMFIFDYTLRVFICKTPSSVKKLVEEASGGDARMEIFVDVILRSLLHSNEELVLQLGKLSSNSSVWMDLEQEEQKRNNVAMEKMAQTLLYKTNKDEASPHLEDDMLRLAILTAFEGAGVQNLIESTSYIMTNGGGCSIDPYAVPIIRALCAYAGGIGEALRLIADSEDKELHEEAWVLPPGALFMGGCAIRGATRWILKSTTLSGKNKSLAILIPVLLNSAHKVEKGLVRYAEAIGGSTTLGEADKFKLLQRVTPQLLPLFNTCNDCARHVVEETKAKPGFRRLESLDPDCQRWLRSILPA